jgi:methyl-accepting chemotaxis protein
MDKVTQNNAARADELTKTAGETDTQAQRLKEHVDELVQNCSALARKALLRMLALY